MPTKVIDKSDEIRFTKMHGIGNDYIYINCLEKMPADLPQLAVEMSDRHFGVGGDGIVLIRPSEVADFKMRMFNNDGSEARMCGNASRCIARYLHDNHLTPNNVINLETLSGIKVLSLNLDTDNEVESVTVDMGEPILNPSKIPADFPGEMMVEQKIHTTHGDMVVTAVSMGNPHCVIFVDKIENEALGRLLPAEPGHVPPLSLRLLREEPVGISRFIFVAAI